MRDKIRVSVSSFFTFPSLKFALMARSHFDKEVDTGIVVVMGASIYTTSALKGGEGGV